MESEEMKGHRPTWLVFFCLFFISIRCRLRATTNFFYKYTNIVKRELYKLVLNVKVVISQQQCSSCKVNLFFHSHEHEVHI